MESNETDEKDFQQRWPKVKLKLKQQYPHLTEEELICEIGKEGELLKKLQVKLGKNWKEIKNMLSLMG
jgi:hypothetical protein